MLPPWVTALQDSGSQQLATSSGHRLVGHEHTLPLHLAHSQHNQACCQEQGPHPWSAWGWQGPDLLLVSVLHSRGAG